MNLCKENVKVSSNQGNYMRYIIGLLFILFHGASQGQASDYGTKTETFALASAEGKAYTVKVTLPVGYDKSKAYKSLYYLDSWWLSELVLGTSAILNLSEQIEDIVLIGVTVDGDLKDWNIQRTMDFTPSQYDIGAMGYNMQAGRGENGITLNTHNTGGANDFIGFLETIVFESIDDTYPNLGNQRGLLGHSYGGLFCFYIMQQRADLFVDYIIISPSLWWNKSELIRTEHFTDLEANGRANSIYLSYGDLESKLISKSNTEMDAMLESLDVSELNYQFNVYQKTNHNSILPKGIYDGLLFTYGK